MSAAQSSSSNGFFTTGAVARIVGKSETTVRQAANSGRLPSVRTSFGARIFTPRDVEIYRASLRPAKTRTPSGEAA
jgi:hypothetical protein